MEQSNTNRAPTESRPPSSGPGGLPEPIGQTQLPPRPPLARADSRPSFGPQGQGNRSNFPPPQPQQRPQFQPGGPVTNPPQFAPRPGTPAPRGPLPTGPPGTQQNRPQGPPLRPPGPQQQFVPQQGPRLLQSPTSGQPPQRVPPPNNLQFGPRQPPQFGATTPESARPPAGQALNATGQPLNTAAGQPINGVPRNGFSTGQAVVAGQIPRQPSQGTLRGLDSNSMIQNQSMNMDNQNYENKNLNKPENGGEAPGMAKGRSYSIAGAPGAPSPLKMEDDRRKSVSSIGGKVEEFASRAPGLGLIQEKSGSKDNIRGSRDSIRSEASNEGNKDVPDRPESRLGSLPLPSLPTAKNKFDDNDDVVLQTNVRNGSSVPPNQRDLSDRSPSLSRSDDSPELKQNVPVNSVAKPTSIPSEPQRPKTPNVKQEHRSDIRDIKSPMPMSKSPIQDSKPPMPVNKKPNEFITNNILAPDPKKSTTPRKAASAPKTRPKDGDNDSGVDESTQGNDMNGSPGSPNKKMSSKLPTKEKSSNSIKTSLSRSSSKSATAKTPENPPPVEKKKVPMNKIQVGNAPSPNIKAVKSKIGSLENATYKPGGGNIKIENRKLEFGNVTPRIAAKNDKYAPSGGVKKIPTAKLEWNAKSKVGSLQNTSYKPGGGDKKIETVKLDFKDKAKPKVASTANIHHKPGGGTIKIENQKLEFKAQSKVGSMDNVKHKPGGGDIKIFDDKDYIKQKSGSSTAVGSHTHSRQEEHYYMSVHEWSEENERAERPMSRCKSARAPRTPRTPRAMSPRRKSVVLDEEEQRVMRNNERNKRASATRPASARDPHRSACSRRGSILQRPAFTVY